jgi:site-specific DNA-methyltransferase (adenine-specific)
MAMSLGIQVSLPIPTQTSAENKAPVWMRELMMREERLWQMVRTHGPQNRHHLSELTTYIHGDALKWVENLPADSIHAVVTDPPYGVIEFDDNNHAKLRKGRGGVWRIPPSFDGAKRSPVPRFTVLSKEEMRSLHRFFTSVAHGLLKVLVPGGHVFIASNPLVSTMTFHAFMEAGFQKRGEIIRLVQTLRGGDRPKGAEQDFPEVTVMPRSCWEPWGVFRKPFHGTVSRNLREWGAGALHRLSEEEPFKDVIQCSPTRSPEKDIAPHPSLKPQRFLRKLVKASLPLGIGIIYDPFAGSGSTLAAAEAVGHHAIGTDSDRQYFAMGKQAFERLASLQITDNNAKRSYSPKPSGTRKV